MSMKDFVNTVPGENQLSSNDYLSYMGCDNPKKKILIVGNSITRHNPKEDIGWFGDWGMAASCADKDYVHILHKNLTEYYGSVSTCVAQMSTWEVAEHSVKEQVLLNNFRAAAEFGADVLVFRIGENIDVNKTSVCELEKDFAHLVSFLGGEKEGVQVLITGLFWPGPVREGILKSMAEEKGYLYVPLDDLGLDASMTAIGLFEHTGVAGHPGDLGMRHIAGRIMDKLMETERKRN